MSELVEEKGRISIGGKRLSKGKERVRTPDSLVSYGEKSPIPKIPTTRGVDFSVNYTWSIWCVGVATTRTD